MPAAEIASRNEARIRSSASHSDLVSLWVNGRLIPSSMATTVSARTGRDIGPRSLHHYICRRTRPITKEPCGRCRLRRRSRMLASTRRIDMIEAHELTKRYGSTVAVDGLSFELQPGRVTGFLGPNGAG